MLFKSFFISSLFTLVVVCGTHAQDIEPEFISTPTTTVPTTTVPTTTVPTTTVPTTTETTTEIQTTITEPTTSTTYDIITDHLPTTTTELTTTSEPTETTEIEYKTTARTTTTSTRQPLGCRFTLMKGRPYFCWREYRYRVPVFCAYCCTCFGRERCYYANENFCRYI